MAQAETGCGRSTAAVSSSNVPDFRYTSVATHHQGFYMVRGSAVPDDNTIMMAPGHETGFGFLTNATIDQHVDVRHRENDLAPVMKAHPDLLGFGLDQATSMTVHGDTLTVNGPKRVAVWDGKDHDGKGYYYLQTGDTLNLVTRVSTFAPHPAQQ